ncbi:MAG TPA: hypothetical protein VGM44_24140 [Polyangiaceae bacterium]
MIRSIAWSLGCAALLGFAIWATNPASAAGTGSARADAAAGSANAAPTPSQTALSSAPVLAPSSSAPSTNPADSSGALERRLDRLEHEIEHPKP